jgi:hypothetical protein
MYSMTSESIGKSDESSRCPARETSPLPIVGHCSGCERTQEDSEPIVQRKLHIHRNHDLLSGDSLSDAGVNSTVVLAAMVPEPGCNTGSCMFLRIFEGSNHVFKAFPTSLK